MEKYLTALSPVVIECVVHMDKLAEPPLPSEVTWFAWLSAVFVPSLHDAIQAHLKDCARCRFQSKIQPVKPAATSRKSAGASGCKPLTAMELGSLCDQAIVSVTADLEKFISDEINTELQKVRDVMVKVRPSVDEETFLENFAGTHMHPTLQNLRAVVEEATAKIDLYQKKLPLVTQVQEQEQLIETLRTFYKEKVLPMAKVAKQTHAISNSKYYVIVPETFVDMVNERIADNNANFKDHVTAWELQTAKNFEIDGKRWVEMPDMTLLGPNPLEGARQSRMDTLVDPDDSVSAVGLKRVSTEGQRLRAQSD